jgi:hypothetical protein
MIWVSRMPAPELRELRFGHRPVGLLVSAYLCWDVEDMEISKRRDELEATEVIPVQQKLQNTDRTKLSSMSGWFD